MTNGEKLKEIFPSIELYEKSHDAIQINFDSVWWNAEYKEPDSIIDLIWEEIENIYLEMPDDYNHPQRTQFYREVKRVFDRYRNSYGGVEE